jgi:hypothetical protein
MTIDVQGPDGSSFSFPDDTPHDVISGAMESHYAGSAPAIQPSAPQPRMLNADLPKQFQAPADPEAGKTYGQTLQDYYQAGADKIKNAFSELKSASNPLTPSFSAPFRTAGALADIPIGAAEAMASPATAAFRHYVSGPEERYIGIPAGEFEGAFQAAGPAKAEGALSMIPRRAPRAPPEINPAVPPQGSALSLPGTLQRAPVIDMGALEDAIGANGIAPAAAPERSVLSPDTPHEMPTGRASVGAAASPDPLAEYSPETIAKVGADLKQSFPTPHLLEQALDERSAHHMLGELDPALESKMGGLAANTGPERAEIVNSVTQRAQEAPQRIAAAFDRAFGPYEDRATLSRLIDIQRDKEAAPFWDKFTTTTIPPFPQLVALTPRLNAAGALQAANKALKIEGLPQVSKWAGVGGREVQLPTARAYQYAKEFLDDKIERALANPGGMNEARRLTQLKNGLVNAIDSHPDPDVAGLWKAARDTYARPEQVKNAAKLGERILTGNIHADELPFMTASFSPAEMAALRIGIRGHLEDIFGRPGPQIRKLINTTLAPSNQRKIRWVIGDRGADDLRAAIEHEDSMHGAPTRIIRGSPTAERTAARVEWGAPESRLESLAGEVPGAVMHPVKAAEREAKAARLREEAARIYTLQGPERDAVARALLGYREDLRFARARGGAVPPLNTRTESHYSAKRGAPDHHCGADRAWPHGACRHYRKPNKCALVGGFIAAHGGCAWYEKAEGGSS